MSTANLRKKYWNIYCKYTEAALKGFRFNHLNLQLLYSMKDRESYVASLQLKLLISEVDKKKKSDERYILTAINKVVANQYKKRKVFHRQKKRPLVFKEKLFFNILHTRRHYNWKNRDYNHAVESFYAVGNCDQYPEVDQYASHWKWYDSIHMWKKIFL